MRTERRKGQPIVALAAEYGTLFLNAEDSEFQPLFDSMLHKLAKIIDVDGVFLFSLAKKHNGEYDQSLISSQCVHGIKCKETICIGNNQNCPVHKNKDNIIEILQRNEEIYCDRSRAREEDICTVGKVQSLIILPIFVDSSLWGFVSIVTCEEERWWEEQEVDSLHLFASICGSALSRWTHTRQICQSHSILRIAAKYGTKFLRKNGDYFDCYVEEFLEELGIEMNADRSYVFTFRRDPEDNTLLTDYSYEWSREGIPHQIDNPNLSALPVFPDLATLMDRFEENETFFWHADDKDFAGHDILEQQDIQSMFLIPIFAGKILWGFIGFDQCTYDRNWRREEIDALCMAANTIGSAVVKNRQLHALKTPLDILMELKTKLDDSSDKTQQKHAELQQLIAEVRGEMDDRRELDKQRQGE